ncbi:hypothetical protein Pcinc_025777 [Petrolisthes cinctipes]|uniref:C3H1-type domain-containing protein n=1 Tax=Petrolisthes cinctipes TaxID=88211 RepID=A0AAE1K8Z0_PETCI|nr:hypothetical protein Pcinc_025777 [Petrolisthes cinctipes]
MKKAIQNASFLAIDCELSGMGDRKKLVEQEMDLRYQYTAETARSHAIISLGISCFTCKSLSTIRLEDVRGGEERSHNYLVQTFNVLTLCSGSFTVECSAHKFLLRHGFDFNKLYSKGLQYYKGCDRQQNEAPSVRHLFSAIVEHRKPIVVHNGLMDLVFLYQSFYADLPRKLETFAADLTDMFPAGIYDTKYIAEYQQRMPASYLEYLFKKMQLRSARCEREGEWHVRVNFPPYPQHLPNVEWHPYQQIFSYSLEADEDKREICYNQGLHGWCSKGVQCQNSHDINKIVKTLQPQGAKKRNNSKYKGAKSTSLTQIILWQADKVRQDRQWHGNRTREESKGNKTRDKVELHGAANRLRDSQDDLSSPTAKKITLERSTTNERISQEGTNNNKEITDERTFRENIPQKIAVHGRISEDRTTTERGITDEKTNNQRKWHKEKTGEVENLQEKTEMRDKEESQGELSSIHNEQSLGETKKRKILPSIAEPTGEINKKAKTTEMNSFTDKDKHNLEMTTAEIPVIPKEESNTSDEKDKYNKETQSKVPPKIPLTVSSNRNKTTQDLPKTQELVNNNKPRNNFQQPSSGHRAGFDAFMTGYIFANHVSGSGTLTSSDALFTPDNIGTIQLVNRVYLMGKNIPFLIRAGTYASMSSNHLSKIPHLRKATVG